MRVAASSLLPRTPVASHHARYTEPRLSSTQQSVQQRQRWQYSHQRTLNGGWIAKWASRQSVVRSSVIMSAASAVSVMEKPVKPSVSAVNECMHAMRGRQEEWASLPHAAKADLLEEVKMRVLDVAESWGSIVPSVKGLDQNATSGPGETVKIAAIVLGMLNRNISVLRHLAKHGKCPTVPIRTLASGQQVAKVFPLSMGDRLDTLGVFGIEAEVWLQPGKPATQGHDMLTNKDGGLAVVLAAGNHSYIGLMDVLEQLFHHNRVAVLKYHEVQAPLTPVLEYVLSPLRELGYVWGVEADLQVTQALIYNPLTTHVHMTGGNSTHDAIVWGPAGPKRQEAMEHNNPLLKVPITSELGNITPWVVTPGGAWTERQLEHHARALTEALLDNCSCNCLAAKVVVIWDDWEHTDAFVSKLKHEICAAPPLPPYYPGCRERQLAFMKQYPQAELLHSCNPSYSSRLGAIPVAMLQHTGVPADSQAEPFLTTEPFSPVITILRLPADPADATGSPSVSFLRQAVQFCNTSLWGNLTCTLLVHPDVQKAHKAEVEEAVAKLEYGLVAVNAWSGLGFANETAFWGGFQGGQSLQSPMSGIGSSHNAYLLDHPQKSVLRAPFICGLHPMPQYRSPLPIPLPLSLPSSALWIVAKLFAGFLASGVGGILRALFWPRSPGLRV